MPEFVKTITKKYNDYVKYLEYHQAWNPNQGYKGLRKKKTKMGTTEERLKQLRTVLRAKAAIHDIVACNTFDYFVTLTISPDGKIDRYNYDDCAKHVSKWLNNHLSHYILVPEKHKDGAFHFHLLADIPSEKLSHLRTPRNLYKYKGRVQKIHSYKYGYSTVIPIEKGTESNLAKYIRKYITKDLMSTVGKNRRTYWASKDLKRPEVTYNEPIPQTAEKVFSMEYLDIFIEHVHDDTT